MSTTVTSTRAPVQLKTQQEKIDVVPQTLKNLTGDIISESGIGWLRETYTAAPIEVMRKRYLEDGYVFLKKLIPSDEILDVREE
jgi:phytanoyl-CoA hydroxylase